jgi:hypothetical protein
VLQVKGEPSGSTTTARSPREIRAALLNAARTPHRGSRWVLPTVITLVGGLLAATALLIGPGNGKSTSAVADSTTRPSTSLDVFPRTSPKVAVTAGAASATPTATRPTTAKPSATGRPSPRPSASRPGPSVGPSDQAFAYNTPFVLKNKASEKALEVWPGSVNDGRAVQRPITAGPNQRWVFAYLGGEGSELRSVGTGNCLEVPEGNLPDPEVPLRQRPCSGAANQRWYIYSSDDKRSLFVQNVPSQHCIGVDNAATTDGADVDQRRCTWNDNDDTAWSLVAMP